jgi:hypothetical protein
VAAAPTLGITPTNTPTLAYEAQWRGDYYNNEELSGNPVATREDAALNFHWDGQEPITGVSWEHWSARWTATLCFEKGPVTFYLRYDDSAKLYVDGVLIEDTTDNPSNETWIPYEASGCNEIVVEYRQGTGGSYLKVGWYQ